MLNLIIIGPPGAGKGTQAALIAKEYNLIHLSSGDMLRHQALKGDSLGQEIKEYQEAGNLVPNSIVIKAVEREITNNLAQAGFIFDGYPRDLEQARSLDKFLDDKSQYIDLVLNLVIKENSALDRIMLRAKSSGRSDDKLETARARFRVYKEQTEPLIQYYRQTEKLVDIDDEADIDNVFEQIKKTLEDLLEGKTVKK